ncbi:transposase [Planomonospora sphaerica]|uniref:Mutator family transposase n=1 Tax=Planomonospora sphaerica TaxID=161355 RepID=A0A171DLX9_9ACTN|nr:transposase [Planomonospora sphaerica]
MVATSYLLGVSARRVDKLVQQLGITGISKSQVSEMAKVLDGQVQAFRTRLLDGGPYAFVWLDALTQEVREDGRTVNVYVCWSPRRSMPTAAGRSQGHAKVGSHTNVFAREEGGRGLQPR